MLSGRRMRLIKMKNINLILALVWFLLLVIFYFVYRRYRSKKGEVLTKPEVKKKPRFFLRKRPVKKREEKIKKMKEEMKQKLKAKERGEIFRLFGVEEGKKMSHVDLLDKIIFAHKLKKKRQRKERDIFKRVEKLIGEAKLKEMEKITEKEAKDIFERLKKIVEGK